MAAAAAAELAAGRPVETSTLVVCLRDFIRQALDLQPVPSHLLIPKQGPSRATQSKVAKKARRMAQIRAAVAGWVVERAAQALAKDLAILRRLSSRLEGWARVSKISQRLQPQKNAHRILQKR